MRIAALADLHFTPAAYEGYKTTLEHVRNEADVLVLAGDLTNYGKASEMEPLLNVIEPAVSATMSKRPICHTGKGTQTPRIAAPAIASIPTTTTQKYQ